MADILKMTIKKDVFDGLASGSMDSIHVESNGYWIRRLALNSKDSFDKLKETQAFRTFDEISVTCLKENAVYQFGSIRTCDDGGFDVFVCREIDIHNADNALIKEESEEIPALLITEVDESYAPTDEITLKLNLECDVVEDVINGENLNCDDNSYEKLTVDDVNSAVDKLLEAIKNSSEYEDATITCYTELPKPQSLEDETETDDEQSLTSDMKIKKETNKSEKVDLNMSIELILGVIRKFNNVYFIKRPYTIITSNGRVFGTRDVLNIKNDTEIQVKVGTVHIKDDTKSDSEFIKKIESYLLDYVKSGYVFILDGGYGFSNDKNGRKFEIRMVKKTYLNL